MRAVVGLRRTGLLCLGLILHAGCDGASIKPSVDATADGGDDRHVDSGDDRHVDGRVLDRMEIGDRTAPDSPDGAEVDGTMDGAEGGTTACVGSSIRYSISNAVELTSAFSTVHGVAALDPASAGAPSLLAVLLEYGFSRQFRLVVFDAQSPFGIRLDQPLATTPIGGFVIAAALHRTSSDRAFIVIAREEESGPAYFMGALVRDGSGRLSASVARVRLPADCGAGRPTSLSVTGNETVIYSEWNGPVHQSVAARMDATTTCGPWAQWRTGSDGALALGSEPSDAPGGGPSLVWDGGPSVGMFGSRGWQAMAHVGAGHYVLGRRHDDTRITTAALHCSGDAPDCTLGLEHDNGGLRYPPECLAPSAWCDPYWSGGDSTGGPAWATFLRSVELHDDPCGGGEGSCATAHVLSDVAIVAPDGTGCRIHPIWSGTGACSETGCTYDPGTAWAQYLVQSVEPSTGHQTVFVVGRDVSAFIAVAAIDIDE